MWNKSDVMRPRLASCSPPSSERVSIRVQESANLICAFAETAFYAVPSAVQAEAEAHFVRAHGALHKVFLPNGLSFSPLQYFH